MPRRHPGSQLAAVASVAVLCLGALCGPPLLRASGGRYVDPKLGYAVDAPEVSPRVWKPARIEGADLAFVARDGSRLSLLSSCDRGEAHPSLLARQLLIGTRDRDLIESYPIALGSDPGWKLVFTAREAGREVTVTTATVASGVCTFDWLWVAVGPYDPELDASWFDRWWASFEREPGASRADAAGPARGEGA